MKFFYSYPTRLTSAWAATMNSIAIVHTARNRANIDFLFDSICLLLLQRAHFFCSTVASNNFLDLFAIILLAFRRILSSNSDLTFNMILLRLLFTERSLTTDLTNSEGLLFIYRQSATDHKRQPIRPTPTNLRIPVPLLDGSFC